jgi:hypothetical protein
VSQITTAYPVDFTVERQLENHNRLTTVFRPILAIPHALLVGGPGMAGRSGVFGAVAGFVALLGWFTILFTGRFPRDLWDLSALYLRWQAKASAYMAMLRDEYPPFGDGEYPAGITLDFPPEPRNRLTAFFRWILGIPHFVVLAILTVALFFVLVIAWFAILITGNYPAGLYGFAEGYIRWSVRVEAYLLLLRDEYPPFRLRS